MSGTSITAQIFVPLSITDTLVGKMSLSPSLSMRLSREGVGGSGPPGNITKNIKTIRFFGKTGLPPIKNHIATTISVPSFKWRFVGVPMIAR